ncbi:MAG: C_GCAxxG_C_C family protein [Promethearchaeota archaeon]|nr:MAG: C_GCAxxG_C_C family protein [Candidatus Lokiarchaeota archaeon]
MKSIESSQKDIFKRFQDKLEELKVTLPPLGGNRGNSCAANTLTSILDVLNLKDFDNVYYNNLAIPFSGFGSYVTRKGWKGPCGIVSGAIAAIGIIMGGQEKAKSEDVPMIYMKALRFADKFEQKFGSLSCQDLCGYDLSKDYQQYAKNKFWEKKCCDFVLFAIELVSKLTKKYLKNKWK